MMCHIWQTGRGSGRTGKNTRYKIQNKLIIPCGNSMSAIKRMIRTHKKFAPTTHTLTFPNYNPLVQQTSHSLRIAKHSSILSSLRRPRAPIPCNVYLPACWLCVRIIAVGMKECRYRFVLLRGILNLSFLSVCLLSNSGLSGCVDLVNQNCPQFVCHWSMISCVYAFLPFPHHPTRLLDVLVESVSVLLGCVPTPASHSKS